MKYSDYVAVTENHHNVREWVNSLSDEKYASLDVSRDLERYERLILTYSEIVKKLKKAKRKLPEPPVPPSGLYVTLDAVKDGSFRFRGRQKRELQEKLYNLPKGTLTDSGW